MAEIINRSLHFGDQRTDQTFPDHPIKVAHEQNKSHIPCQFAQAEPPTTAYDTLITVWVGGTTDAPTQLLVHRGLLSFYLKRGFHFNFRIDDTAIEASGIAASTFDMFRQWLYNGKKALYSLAGIKDIVELYAFAFTNDVPDLENACLDVYFLLATQPDVMIQDLTQLVYSMTSPGSRLRRLHVDTLVELWDFKDLDDEVDSFTQEMLKDFLNVCRDRNIVPGKYKAFARDEARKDSAIVLPHDALVV
ncbi:hypothetical protein BU23DRAFT_555822 [Bimuria novae-zelandiae CBS 107.79]|uniref:BTB domain-containing protein n=1 Tax=Bimuria novae-zelandiae CBS 107.79 TaxID=1447943 RepID=A0A6A5V9E5_9PLEO|nr:hypothetical protein BU23DRAFT_555822 [Bimuria novae-zelandiae CBS 107.79]